jgi:T5SS/PEP-CTERM-associated repeat protein
VRIAADGPPGGGSGTVTVSGSGSTFVQTGANGFTIGHASTGTAPLNVNTDGTVSTGTGATAINKTGTVNIGGGTFNVNGDSRSATASCSPPARISPPATARGSA